MFVLETLCHARMETPEDNLIFQSYPPFFLKDTDSRDLTQVLTLARLALY